LKETIRVLITGGAGFIGSRLALELKARGHSVAVLDCLSTQIHGSDPESSSLYRSIAGEVDFMRGDVTSRADLEKALAGVEAVVHLAAETGTGQSMYAIKRYTDVNVGGTALLLELAADARDRIRKIVVASSRAIYGEGKYECTEHGAVYPGPRSAKDMDRGDFEVHCPKCGEPSRMVPTDEDSPPAPTSIYGITKLAQEQMVLAMGLSLGIPACALRFQNVYGPGQSLSNPYTGILSIFSTRIRNGKGINIFEDGSESRDFVYIDDVVRATADSVEDRSGLSGAYNIGSGAATTVLEVAEALKKRLRIDATLTVSGNYRLGDIRHNVADLGRAAGSLGYAPRVAFAEGIARFAEWVESERVTRDLYDESIQEMKAKGLYK
jgi:dTDP-L-rhamnose 4-epimerase